MKISLKFHAMSILMAELQETQMWAIYQISLGQDMPDSVTKNDLIKVIELLLEKLDWIEKDEASTKPTSSLDAITDVTKENSSRNDCSMGTLTEIDIKSEFQENNLSEDCSENQEAHQNDHTNAVAETDSHKPAIGDPLITIEDNGPGSENSDSGLDEKPAEPKVVAENANDDVGESVENCSISSAQPKNSKKSSA